MTVDLRPFMEPAPPAVNAAVLFDVIRRIKGATLTQGDVDAVNAALNGGRSPSPACAALIQGYEKCRLAAYRPTPNDVPTIGWGATGPDVRMGMVWTQRQADERFARDLAAFAAGVDHLVGAAPTTQGQFDALVSFAYNVGLDDDADKVAEGLGDSTLLRKHLAGDYAGALAQFPLWNRQKGVVLNGLTRRRADEARLYAGLLA